MQWAMSYRCTEMTALCSSYERICMKKLGRRTVNRLYGCSLKVITVAAIDLEQSLWEGEKIKVACYIEIYCEIWLLKIVEPCTHRHILSVFCHSRSITMTCTWSAHWRVCWERVDCEDFILLYNLGDIFQLTTSEQAAVHSIIVICSVVSV